MMHGVPDRFDATTAARLLGDPERLAVLERLELAGPAALDRWTRVTAEALHAPIVLLSMLGADRQHVVSRVGIADPGFAAGGLDPRETICTATLAGAPAPLAVEDARAVPQLACTASVQEVGIVGYLGAPLVVCGQPVGVLCAFEPDRRRWLPADVRLIGRLAEAIALDLESRLMRDELERSAQILAAHNQVHELIALGEPGAEVHDALIGSIEAFDPRLTGSVLLLDAAGTSVEHVIAPNLPADYCAALQGLAIGEGVGSCGHAMATGEPVISEDLAKDPKWDTFLHLAEPIGLRHCWSHPIKIQDDTVVGSFAVYGHEARRPCPAVEGFLQDTARLAGIAIEHRRRLERLVHDATHDALTGLLHRAALVERLSDALDADRTGDGQVAVLYCDIDRMQAVNDRVGHDTGDRVLGQVAGRLRAALGPDDLLGRIGGEEFLVVRPSSSRAQAIALGEALLASVWAPLGVGTEEPVTVTLSVGVALVSGDEADEREAVRRAALAVADAKEEGGGTLRLLREDSRPRQERRLAVEGALRNAVERGEMSVAFQPIHDLARERVTGVEALCRWTHPELGAVCPAEFIPIAERTGQIEWLGAWVLREACLALGELQRRYGEHAVVGVNVSACQLRRPAFADLVTRTLRETGADPRRLVLEVTETTLLSSDPTTAATLRRLDALGCSLVLDDFGTGFCSLAVLKAHPIRGIKIDRSFVTDLPGDPGDLAIVTAIVGMADALGLNVVAEGIETPEQLALLGGLGCAYGQGYLLGRPGPVWPAASSTAV